MPMYHNWNLRNKDLAQTLDYYLVHGFEPGGFTTAILAGDLFAAVSKADRWNRPAIAEIAEEVVRQCPLEAYGSYKAVNDWCNDRFGMRTQYAERKQQEYTMQVLKDEVNTQTDDFPF